MPTTSKYLKLWLILIVPLFLGLMWRGFASLLTGGGSQNPNTINEQNSSESSLIREGDPQGGGFESPDIPSLWSSTTPKPTQPETIRIAVPDRFDTSTMADTQQALTADQITLKRVVVTGSNYHDTLYTLMASGAVDLSLIATDRGNDCTQWCAIRFAYSQPIDAFILSPVIDAIQDSHWTMIPYGLDPLVTYHAPQRRVSGSRSALLNDILVSTSSSTTAWSLPLSIGIWAADQALLRAGKESYPWYTHILHNMIIQFSSNQTLLSQLTQLADTAKLRSYSRMTKIIETIADKFPICEQTVAACLVRFNVSYYGFGYLTDLMRLPPSWSSTIAYDQFPIETNYYPVRLRWFIINKRSNSSPQAVSRFISAYVTSMINLPGSTQNTSNLWPMTYNLLSPFTTRFEAQWYDPQFNNIMRYTDSFRIEYGGRSTSLDRARNWGLMSVLEGNSSIQVYLTQQGIN